MIHMLISNKAIHYMFAFPRSHHKRQSLTDGRLGKVIPAEIIMEWYLGDG